MPVDRLPVVDHVARVLAHQVRFNFPDGRLTRQGAALEKRLAQADDAGIGVNLEEQPARPDEEGFQPGDAQWIAWLNGSVGPRLLLGAGGFGWK